MIMHVGIDHGQVPGPLSGKLFNLPSIVKLAYTETNPDTHNSHT